MLKVVVIGSGNVAQHLVTAFGKTTDVKVVQVFARKPQSMEHLIPEKDLTDTFNNIADADIYIIAVTDSAIAELSSQLPFEGRLVVHTSGSMPLTEINPKNRQGVFYPLQTFSKNKPVDFSAIPVCLESSLPDDYMLLEQLAKSISGSVYGINSQQRQALHVAAVFVSNFANHMYSVGKNICDNNNIPFSILKPLIQETAAKVQQLEPEKAQTGPAIRRDSKTIEKHLDFLQDEMQKNIYTLLTEAIQKANG